MIKTKHSLLLIFFIILVFYFPFFEEGMIIFSDIAVGTDINRYMEEIFSLWNGRFNTTTMMNMPRLIIIIPSYLISKVLGAQWLTKIFVIQLTIMSAYCQYYFSKSLVIKYIKEKTKPQIIELAAICSALLYALNPWFMVRIQHTYLLCGYALYPLIIHFYLQLFNQKYLSQIFFLSQIIIFSTILSIASSAIHYFFFSLISIGILFLTGLLKKIFSLPKDHLKKVIQNELKKVIILGLFTLLSCSFWLLPYIYSILTGRMTSQANINVEDTLMMFSRQSSFWNVITSNSYWWSMFPKDQAWHQFHLSWCYLLIFIFFGFLSFLKKNDLIKLFFGLYILLIIVATGTYYSFLAPFHHFLVFKIPIFGNIFRDPNKIIGIQLFFCSTALGLGILKLLQIPFKTIRYSLATGLLISFIGMNFPYYKNYLLNLYFPTLVPSITSHINKYLKDDQGKVTYLPQAEDRVDHQKNIAELNWNQNLQDSSIGKSVGDFHVYGTKKDTTFQYEGNLPIIGYQYSYIQNLLDHGKSVHLSDLLDDLYSSQLVYQKDYSNFKEKEKFNQEILNIQNGLFQSYQSHKVDIYDLENRDSRVADIYNKLILTNGGLNKKHLYSYLSHEDISRQGVLYSHQQGHDLDTINKLPLVFDYRQLDQLLPSLISDRYLIKPFDFINRSSAFLGWAKTSIYKYEWNWFLESMGIDYRDYPIAHTGALVTAFSPSRLKVKPYEEKHLKGKYYHSLDSLLVKKNFFLQNEDNNIKIQVWPKTKLTTPLVVGNINPGEPSKIWHVAKTKEIKIKEANPYSIKIGLSGRNAQSVHLKLHFFDNNKNELNVTYLARPDQVDNFDQIHFKTLFITPKNAQTMSISILSSKKVNQRVLWWLHQFQINDLEDYKEDNKIFIHKKIKRKTDYIILAKLFFSPKGGIISFNFPEGLVKKIQTKTLRRGLFDWTNLGIYNFSQSELFFNIDNAQGFNAIGDLIIIPHKDYIQLKKDLKRKIKTSNRIISFEAELDVKETPDFQSQRNYPQLSGAKAYAINNFSFVSDFNIEKKRDFSLEIKGFNLNISDLNILIKKKDISFYPNHSFIKTNNYNKTLFVKKENNIIINKLFELKNKIPLTSLKFKDFKLERGQYQIQISNKNKPDSISKTEDLKELYTFIKPQKNNIKKEVEACCQCDNTDLLKNQYQNKISQWSVYSTNTCGWHIIQAKTIKVTKGHQYYLDYFYQNFKNKKSHQKVLFLDKEGQEIGKKYIPAPQLQQDGHWINKKELITPPDNTDRILLLFLFQGKYHMLSELHIKNLRIIDHTLLPAIDFILLREKKLNFNKTRISKYNKDTDNYKEIVLGSSFKEDNPSISFNLPLHKIWEPISKNKSYKVNGIFHSFQLSGSKIALKINSFLILFYFLGLIIHLGLIIYSLAAIKKNLSS